MDPVTVGAIFLVAVVVGALVVGFATGVIRIGSDGRRPPRPPRESALLTVTPDLICPKADCSAQIRFDTTTAANGATGVLSVRTPSGTERVLANGLSGRLNVAGNDGFFADGPGQYTFTFVADGLQRGRITLRDDVVLMTNRSHRLSYSSAVPFGTNASVYERQTARDVFILGEGDFGKGHRRFTFCEKMTALSDLRYVSGGVPGSPNALTITVYNLNTGQVAASGTLSPGDVLAVSPAITMAEGAGIELIMSAYNGGSTPEANAFPGGSTVTWLVSAGLECL